MSSDDNNSLNERLRVLLPKCARSDEVAFADVYNLTSPKLFAVLVRMLGMNDTAEQALHDVYVNIWSRSNEYRTELGQPMPWLTSFARGHALNILRERRLVNGASATTDNAGTSTTGDSPLASSEEVTFQDKGEDARLLESCLNRLSENPRDCLVRAYNEGLSHEELSQMHGAPVATTKGWITRGLLSLKECVDARA